MRHLLLVFGLLFTGLSLAAPACNTPATPEISNEELSKRQERSLQRNVLRYFEDIERFSACVKRQFANARNAGAPETELMALVSFHNETVAESKEVAEVYEARVGPVMELASLYSPRPRWGGPQPYWPPPRTDLDSTPIGPKGPPPAPGSAEWGDPNYWR